MKSLFSDSPIDTDGLDGEPDYVRAPAFSQPRRSFPGLRASAVGVDVEPTVASFGVRVTVVIPTLNEERNLPDVLSWLPRGLHEVIVVDGLSTDGTVAVAKRLGPDVRIVMQSGRGKGNALAAGFAACTGDIVVTLDADGSTDAAEIPRFVAALCHGADFVKGSRFAQGGASSHITRTRRWGNHARNALVNGLYGTSYTDLCFGSTPSWLAASPTCGLTARASRSRRWSMSGSPRAGW